MDKICGNCSFLELKKIGDGVSAYCCVAHSIVKGGTKYQDPKGVLPHFKCNCGKFNNKYGNE